MSTDHQGTAPPEWLGRIINTFLGHFRISSEVDIDPGSEPVPIFHSDFAPSPEGKRLAGKTGG